MLIDIYKTALGSHLNTKDINNKMMEFMIRSSNVNNLSYEYVIDKDIKLVIITGKNDDERELPSWSFPIFVDDVRGNTKLFLDVRSYVRITNPDFLNVNEIVTNRPMFDFALIQAVYSLLLSNNDLTKLAPIRNVLIMAFSKWFASTIRGSLSLSVGQSIDLEIVCMHYIIALTSDEIQDATSASNITYKITTMMKMVRGNTKYVSEVCSKLNHNPRNAVDLVSNIKIGVNSDILNNLDTTILYNMVAGAWFGFNAKENVVISIEHIPTLIAIIYSAAGNKSFKNSKLANILAAQERDIGSSELIKSVNNTLKDITI